MSMKYWFFNHCFIQTKVIQTNMRRHLLLLLFCFIRLNLCLGQEISTAFKTSDGQINASAYDASTQKLYVAGDFTAFGNPNSANFACLNTVGTNIENALPKINGQVNKIIQDGSNYYVVGKFHRVNGELRMGIVKLNASRQVDLSFKPALDFADTSMSAGNEINDIAISGNTIVVSGKFRIANSTKRIALIDKTNGFIYSWSPEINVFSSSINCIKVYNSQLYVGGSFNLTNYQVSGSTPIRSNFAVFNITNPFQVLLSNVRIMLTGNSNVNVFSMESVGSTLYVGGNFDKVGTNTISDIFALNMNLGTVNTSFNAKLSPSTSSYVSTVSIINANQLFIGGNFTTIASVNRRSNFILVTSNGSINVNAPLNIASQSQTIVRQITSVGIGTNLFRVFVNGPFNTINGSNRIFQGMVAYDFNSLTGSFTLANQIVNGTAGPVNTCIKDPNGNLILGGSFSFAGGVRCPHLAVFNSNGTIDLTVSNPFLLNSNGDISIKSICLSGSSLYLGGRFKPSNSATPTAGRNDVLKLSKVTLATDLNFPQLDASSTNSVNVITADGINLYIGGLFTKYISPNGNTVSKSNFFAWNSSSNNAINYTGDLTNGQVNDITYNSSAVFIGGTFSTSVVGNSPGLAKFSKSSFNLQPFITSRKHTSVTGLKIINSNIYVAELKTISSYDIGSNELKNLFTISSGSSIVLNAIYQVSTSLFIAGGNGTKLYYAPISNNSFYQTIIQMNEDARFSDGFRLLNYIPSLSTIYGVYKENNRYDYKGFTTIFANGKNTSITLNNNLLPPAPPTPTTASTLINFVPTATTIKMTWNAGNGSRRIVLARKNTDPFIPAIMPTSIVASNNFGSGTNVGNATFCVYDGDGSEVTINNLQILSDYRFTIIEYNLSNTANNNSAIRTYNTATYPLASCITLDYSAPNVPTNITYTTSQTAAVTLSYIPGNGSSRMCIIKEGANSINFSPVKGQSYFNGQVLSDSSSVVEFSVTNQPLVINSLNTASTYSIAFFEYNMYAGAGPRYMAIPTKLNVTTLDYAPMPTISSSNLVASNVSKTSAKISWSKGSGLRSLVMIAKSPKIKNQNGHQNFFPIWGVNYTAVNTSLTAAPFITTDGSILTTGNLDLLNAQLLYHSVDTNINVTNLTPGTSYQITVMESNGFNSQVSYSVPDLRPVISFTTLPIIIPPSLTTNNHTINVSQDDAKLNWSGGNGSNSLVFLRKGEPVNIVPSNDVNYNTNNIYASSNALYSNGNYAVYTGSSSGLVNITNLEPDVEYHFAIYDYNTQTGEYKYNPTPYRGIFKTAKAWPVRAGGIKKDAGGGIVTDASGNVYVAGAFEQFASWGTLSIPSYGSTDIFLAKYSSSGKPQWVIKQGGSSADAASSVALDFEGNLIITGSFRSTGTFGQGNVFTSNGIDDIFLSKISPAGSVIWSKRAGGSDQDVAYAITSDNTGNIYLTGYFRGTMSFPNSAVTLTSMGGTDAFVAKYDSSGNIIWAKSGGGTGNDFAYGVTVNGNNIAIVGQFDATSTFSGATISSSGLSDIFLAEYTAANGALNWINKYGGSGTDIGFSVTTALNDYVITGQFSNVLSVGTTTLNSFGNSDILVARITSTGQVVWFKRAGGVSQDAGRGIALNSSNDKLFVTGSFAETAMFGTNSVTSFGNLDVFVATVDFATGNFETIFQNGGPSDDEARGITANSSNSSFVTGYFNGQGSFGNVDLTSAGDWDVFIHKFTLVVAPDLSNGMVAWYKMNGDANDASGNGNNGIAQNIVSTTNRSNEANGAYQFQQGTLIDVIKVDPINVAGTATTATSTLVAWIKTPANYSNSTIPKPIFSTSIDDIEYRSIQLSDIGTISYSYFNPNTSLQVDQTSLIPIQDNTWHHIAVVFKSGIELIFYLDGNEIGRKSIANFYETENLLSTHWNIGHITYADRLTKLYSFNGSLDDLRLFRRALSSAEINSIKNQSTLLGKNELSFSKKLDENNKFKLWPNPTNGSLNVNFGKLVNNLKVNIVDVSGKEIYTKVLSNCNQSELSIDLEHLTMGYYFVQLETDGHVQTHKLVISK
jgi:hypothetical protein